MIHIPKRCRVQHDPCRMAVVSDGEAYPGWSAPIDDPLRVSASNIGCLRMTVRTTQPAIAPSKGRRPDDDPPHQTVGAATPRRLAAAGRPGCVLRACVLCTRC